MFCRGALAARGSLGGGFRRAGFDMERREFKKTIESILRDDPRYAVGAYVFVRMGLDFAVKRACAEDRSRRDRHVSAKELLEAIRVFALETFGPMAKPLFDEWGVRGCEDIGEIVFNLVDAGALRKNDDDKIEDFSGGYDFYEAFVLPFKPRGRRRRCAG